MKKNLAAQEFVEKYPNRKIFLGGIHCPSQKANVDDNIKIDPNKKYVARIVGYCDSKDSPILLRFEEPWLINRSYTFNEVSFHINMIDKSYINSSLRYWPVNINEIDISSSRPVSAYPNKCHRCKCPARIIGEITFCSNIKCASRVKVKKMVALYSKQMSPVPATSGINSDGYVICPKCSGLAVSSNTNRTLVSCYLYHRWPHQWSDGQKLAQSQYGGNYKDSVYNAIAGRFQNIL